ncbi:MAG: O-antigen ligase family protein [Planctomycetota bacterium]
MARPGAHPDKRSNSAERRRRAVWPWALAYALLALPFLPFWPDFETARRGVGLVLGGVALLALAAIRSEADLPRRLHLAWLLVVAFHVGSCAWAQNQGEACARSLWLLALWAFATLAARTSSLHQQLAAFEWPGLAVFAFGIAQVVGLTWPFGYSLAAEPVSTLGNRNVAAEVAVVALVAASLRLLRHDRVAVTSIAVVLGAAYVWLNHSRSGLLAGGLTLLPLVLAPGRQHSPRRRLLLLVLLATGLGVGRALAPPSPAPARPDAGGRDAEHTTADIDATAPPSTIEVRTEMWAAGLRMLRQAPWLGFGAAQFQVHYPRFRSQREIALSTHDYEFLAAPRTPHQDPLEVAIEVGLLGFLPFAAFWILVLRRRRRGTLGLMPIAAFLVLGLVRSPLGNAPAAAFAFACVGALCREQQARRAVSRRSRLPFLLAGAGAIYVGVRVTAAQCAAAPAMEARLVPPEDPRRRGLDELHALDRATALCPWDASLLEMQVSRRLALATERGDRATIRTLAARDGELARLLSLKPYATGASMLAARVHQASGDLLAAMDALRRVLAQDPANPEARLFLATLCTQADRPADAVSTLYADGHPHPKLREGLARHLHDLARLATSAGARALLQREAAFVDAVDAVRDAPDDPGTVPKVIAFVQAEAIERSDLRPLVLLAAASLQRGDRAAAEDAAKRAPPDARLQPQHAPLLREVAEPLRAVTAWRPLLPDAP